MYSTNHRSNWLDSRGWCWSGGRALITIWRGCWFDGFFSLALVDWRKMKIVVDRTQLIELGGRWHNTWDCGGDGPWWNCGPNTAWGSMMTFWADWTWGGPVVCWATVIGVSCWLDWREGSAINWCCRGDEKVGFFEYTCGWLTGKDGIAFCWLNTFQFELCRWLDRGFESVIVNKPCWFKEKVFIWGCWPPNWLIGLGFGWWLWGGKGFGMVRSCSLAGQSRSVEEECGVDGVRLDHGVPYLWWFGGTEKLFLNSWLLCIRDCEKGFVERKSMGWAALSFLAEIWEEFDGLMQFTIGLLALGAFTGIGGLFQLLSSSLEEAQLPVFGCGSRFGKSFPLQALILLLPDRWSKWTYKIPIRIISGNSKW